MHENNSLKKSQPWLSTLFIFLLFTAAVLSRIVPHPANMTALVPVAVIAGFIFGNLWIATLVPLAGMLVTDAFFFSFYPGIEFVYVAVLASMLMGRAVRGKKWPLLAAGGLTSSVLFFVISNFGVWMTTSLYAKTWEGLVQCYLMAVPFFRNQLIGDVVYGALLVSAVVAIHHLTRKADAYQAHS